MECSNKSSGLSQNDGFSTIDSNFKKWYCSGFEVPYLETTSDSSVTSPWKKPCFVSICKWLSHQTRTFYQGKGDKGQCKAKTWGWPHSTKQKWVYSNKRLKLKWPFFEISMSNRIWGCQAMWWFDPNTACYMTLSLGICILFVACWKGNHPRIWDWEFQKPSSDSILSCAPPECVFFLFIFFLLHVRLVLSWGTSDFGFRFLSNPPDPGKLSWTIHQPWTQVALFPQPLATPVKRRTRHTVTPVTRSHRNSHAAWVARDPRMWPPEPKLVRSRRIERRDGKISWGDQGIAEMGWRSTGIFLIPWWMGIIHKGIYWDNVYGCVWK